MSARPCLIIALAATLLAGPAPAHAAVDKGELLQAWTQTSAASFTKWNDARQHRQQWAKFNFDWSTDGCTGGSDRPLGFDFRVACKRHDFGYRNYGKAGKFTTNKARLDSAFLADLRRVCDTRFVLLRPACDTIAWTYYRAAKAFGHA